MNNFIYEQFLLAKNNKDLLLMESLYKENSHELIIKFEYRYAYPCIPTNKISKATSTNANLFTIISF